MLRPRALYWQRVKSTLQYSSLREATSRPEQPSLTSNFFCSEIGATRELRRVIRGLVQHLLSLNIANAHSTPHVLLAIECSLAWIVIYLYTYALRVLV